MVIVAPGSFSDERLSHVAADAGLTPAIISATTTDDTNRAAFM
jgi:hypothetical protein